MTTACGMALWGSVGSAGPGPGSGSGKGRFHHLLGTGKQRGCRLGGRRREDAFPGRRVGWASSWVSPGIFTNKPERYIPEEPGSGATTFFRQEHRASGRLTGSLSPAVHSFSVPFAWGSDFCHSPASVQASFVPLLCRPQMSPSPGPCSHEPMVGEHPESPSGVSCVPAPVGAPGGTQGGHCSLTQGSKGEALFTKSPK